MNILWMSWNIVFSSGMKFLPPSWYWSWATALIMRTKKKILTRTRQIPWN